MEKTRSSSSYKFLQWIKSLFSIRDLFLLREYSRKRVFGLDLMRSIAILLVVFSHYMMPFHLNKRIAFILSTFTGTTGVEIFFVLSGFLIGGILMKIYNAGDKLTFSQIKDFWIRRWFRTLPNYYLAIILIVVSTYMYNNEFLFKDWKYLLYQIGRAHV